MSQNAETLGFRWNFYVTHGVPTEGLGAGNFKTSSTFVFRKSFASKYHFCVNCGRDTFGESHWRTTNPVPDVLCLICSGSAPEDEEPTCEVRVKPDIYEMAWGGGVAAPIDHGAVRATTEPSGSDSGPARLPEDPA